MHSRPAFLLLAALFGTTAFAGVTMAAGQNDGLRAECDRLAADPEDMSRPQSLAGVQLADIDTDAAIGACKAALSAALRIRGVANVAIGCLATDGDDGVSGVAGGIVDGQTIASDSIVAARHALDSNDSGTFLRQAGADFAPGMTGTNVNDLTIIVVR